MKWRSSLRKNAKLYILKFQKCSSQPGILNSKILNTCRVRYCSTAVKHAGICIDKSDNMIAPFRLLTLLPPCLRIFFAKSYLSNSCFCPPIGASDEKACLTLLQSSARPNLLNSSYEYSWSLARYPTRVWRNNRRVDVSTSEYGRFPSHKLRTSTGVGSSTPHTRKEYILCTSVRSMLSYR